MNDTNGHPTVLIVGVSPDVATALNEVVSLAQCIPLAADNFDRLGDLRNAPDAIIARVRGIPSGDVSREALANWPTGTRPFVVALVSTDEDIAEAERLHCDVVLREPWQVRGLYDTLTSIASLRPRETTSTGR